MNIHDVNKYIYKMQAKSVPQISPGDTITISENIVEGKKTRVQKFQAIVLSNTKTKLNQSVLVRKKFQDFWIEKRFFIHSPMIADITVDTKGHARRAFLSYLRNSKHLAKKLKRLKK